MATRPSLNIAVPKRKNKASEYNENFDLMMDYIDASLQESKDYVDGYMPAISSSTKGKFLTNNGAAASWGSLGNQPFGDYIKGLIITKSSNNTIAVSEGSCYDNSRTIILILGSATTKQNGSQAANTTYYVYIIGNGVSVDILITTSSSSPTLPTGYVYYRQIGYYTTDSNGNIEYIYHYGTDPNSPVSIQSFLSPDYTAGVSKSNAGFTADAPGWLYILGGDSTAANNWVQINGSYVFLVSQSATGGTVIASSMVPIFKNDVVTTHITSRLDITFYPLRGA